MLTSALPNKKLKKKTFWKWKRYILWQIYYNWDPLTWMSMASHSVPRIRLISSSICRAMPGFCLLWRLAFDLFPFYFNSHLMPWCHRRNRHYLIIISPFTICLFLSSKNICCHPPFRMLRPCFKRKSEMRVNFVFRAALKSGVDTPSNLLSDSKSSVTKTVDIFLQCIWSAPLVTKCPEEKLRFPIGNMSTL